VVKEIFEFTWITAAHFFRQGILRYFQPQLEGRRPMPGGQPDRILRANFGRLAKPAKDFRESLIPECVFDRDRQKERPLKPSRQQTESSSKLNWAFAGIRKTAMRGHSEKMLRMAKDLFCGFEIGDDPTPALPLYSEEANFGENLIPLQRHGIHGSEQGVIGKEHRRQNETDQRIPPAGMIRVQHDWHPVRGWQRR
jgi:hypothetical protein